MYNNNDNNEESYLFSANTSIKDSSKRKQRKSPIQKDNNLAVKKIVPKTAPQKQMMQSFIGGYNIIATGSAGTGKSYIASYLALDALFRKEVSKIIVVRSAVPSRDMGFLPGSLQEKTEIFTIPYKQIFDELCENGTAWDVLVKKGMVEFITTSYVRGITLNDSVVIVDEAQNMNFHELDSVITRMGGNTRLFVCGDTKQCDLTQKKEKSGLEDFVSVASKMTKYFDTVNFTKDDIVRSELVKDWITTKEDMDF